jgi:dTDP-4-amino-4,6-dideoxygalactose transaminase
MSREVLSLPIYPELTDAEAETVAKTVKDFFRKS